MEEENLVKIIIEKERWEEIIYYVVSLENLNPWDIDLVKLCNGFINFLKRVQELDFRIPAKIIFIAVILLRLKSEYLFMVEEETKQEEKKQEVEKINIEINIEKPIRRIAKSPITLTDLINALKKVVELKERKERRIWERRKKVEKLIEAEKYFEERVNEVWKIISIRENLTFRELVGEWKREKIVENFLPVLHLDNNGKIDCIQEDFFQEIFIKKKV